MLKWTGNLQQRGNTGTRVRPANEGSVSGHNPRPECHGSQLGQCVQAAGTVQAEVGARMAWRVGVGLHVGARVQSHVMRNMYMPQVRVQVTPRNPIQKGMTVLGFFFCLFLLLCLY